MPQRTLSSRALASAHAQTTDEVWLLLLRVIHPDIVHTAEDLAAGQTNGVLRFVNNNEDITGGSDNKPYIAFPYQFDLPGEDPEQPSVARLRIDNVDLRIIEQVRALSSPPECDVELVLASQPLVVEISFEGMTLRTVEFDSMIVEGALTMEEIFVEPVSLEMTPARFPSLF
jgi:hypothetical protein